MSLENGKGKDSEIKANSKCQIYEIKLKILICKAAPDFKALPGGLS